MKRMNFDRMFVGWGRKPSGYRAIVNAHKVRKHFTLQEDGFLRSVGREGPAISIVHDAKGIYYDASAPSDLETLVAQKLTSEQMLRTRNLVKNWRDFRLSKYNSSADYTEVLPDRYVLVVDQVVGDLSIRFGGANSSSFDTMLNAALFENPEATIIVKTHPDSVTRAKKSHFDAKALTASKRLKIITENCHPVRLIEQAEAVYTVTSQVGFEALIWGKKVHCFGVPFYAGWGLTNDRIPTPERRSQASLEQLVYASLVRYPIYTDPDRNCSCEVEVVMNHIGLQRSMRSRFPRKIVALGFSRWKRSILRSFVNGSQVKFLTHERQIKDGDTVALWGNKKLNHKDKQINILRVEDGFLRSSGLGADLIRPISWVIDGEGIYYDPAQPSRLQYILATYTFNIALIDQARRLREIIFKSGISKYNLPGTFWIRPFKDRKIILVPGQVDDDASIVAGCSDINTNLMLLRTVRVAEPEAYIVYKPHPDVEARLRRGDVDDKSILLLCDEIVSNGDVAQLLGQVDEVHTMTSLTGFEALLRDIPVTCYGTPFYAGWGLTTDKDIVSARGRKLILDELIAGALILYPTYINRVTGCFTTPERALEELIEWRKNGSVKPTARRKLVRFFLLLWQVLVARRKSYNDS
ncbi:MAG: hypothetical protein V7701_14595 [Sneathiella sp.]